MVVLFTDGLHSTRDLDFERQALKPTRFPALIRALPERYGWRLETLAGARLAVVLPSLDCCTTAKAVNDRVVLEKFHRALAASRSSG